MKVIELSTLKNSEKNQYCPTMSENFISRF